MRTLRIRCSSSWQDRVPSPFSSPSLNSSAAWASAFSCHSTDSREQAAGGLGPENRSILAQGHQQVPSWLLTGCASRIGLQLVMYLPASGRADLGTYRWLSVPQSNCWYMLGSVVSCCPALIRGQVTGLAGLSSLELCCGIGGRSDIKVACFQPLRPP